MKPEFEVGKTYKTRSGLDARVICADRQYIGSTPAQPIIALVKNRQGYEFTVSTALDGRVSRHRESDLDLMLPKPEMIERWLNVYDENNINISSSLHGSRDVADWAAEDARIKRIACLHLRFCDGAGLTGDKHTALYVLTDLVPLAEAAGIIPQDVLDMQVGQQRVTIQTEVVKPGSLWDRIQRGMME